MNEKINTAAKTEPNELARINALMAEMAAEKEARKTEALGASEENPIFVQIVDEDEATEGKPTIH